MLARPSWLEVDEEFVQSIFSTKEFTANLDTLRKQRILVFYFLLMTLSVVSLGVWHDRIMAVLFAYTKLTVLAVAVVVYSLEPCMLVLQTLVFAHPPIEKDNGVKEDTSEVAIVISCHKSADVIVRTVRACLQHVNQEQVFIMDNANLDAPPDNTREVLIEAGLPGVNYIYNPFGNKTLAMYAGSVAAKDYSKLLLIDDDVTVPPDMKFGLHWFSDRIKAICYPIRAVPPEDDGPDDGSRSLFIDWQDIEYKMADYTKLLQNEYCTVLFPHGAICLWDRATLIRCFRDHDTVFYADDVKMGMWFQHNNYEMRIYHQTVVDTDAPASYIGSMPNYYNQRVRSWDMAEHAYCYEFFRLLFTTRLPTFSGTLVMKWFQFYSCYCIIADWIRLPLIILTLMTSWEAFSIVSASFVVLYTILCFVWDYLGYRKCPHRRSRKIALLTFQFYKLTSVFIRLLGMGRTFSVYLLNYKQKPMIPQLEEQVLKQRSGEVDASVEPIKTPVWMSNSPYYSQYDPSNPTKVWVDEECGTSVSEESELSPCSFVDDEFCPPVPTMFTMSLPTPGDDAVPVLKPSTKGMLDLESQSNHSLNHSLHSLSHSLHSLSQSMHNCDRLAYMNTHAARCA